MGGSSTACGPLNLPCGTFFIFASVAVSAAHERYDMLIARLQSAPVNNVRTLAACFLAIASLHCSHGVSRVMDFMILSYFWLLGPYLCVAAYVLWDTHGLVSEAPTVLREREVLSKGVRLAHRVRHPCVITCSWRGDSAAAEDGQTRGEADMWCNKSGDKH